jgi:hypothetical protein
MSYSYRQISLFQLVPSLLSLKAVSHDIYWSSDPEGRNSYQPQRYIMGFSQLSALRCLTNLVEGIEVGRYRNSSFAA